LTELAARLGSDVPFFFAGGTAACRGRGEIVEPIAGMPRLDVVIVKPPAGVSTPQAFAALNAGPVNGADAAAPAIRIAEIVDALRRGRIVEAGGLMCNRLEATAGTLCEWIGRLRDAFARLGCAAHMMTGSGSAYFGLMRSAWQARRAAGLLRAMDLGAVYATATRR
jgi:4-diphosphocytidyl-2-C-methyl-D-erythritol kinase